MAFFWNKSIRGTIEYPAMISHALMEQRVRQFLLNNGYYELEAPVWTFKNYPESGADIVEAISPVATQHTLEFHLEAPGQLAYVCRFEQVPKAYMRAYQRLLSTKLGAAISGGSFEILDKSELDHLAEVQVFGHIPKWVKSVRFISPAVLLLLAINADWKSPFWWGMFVIIVGGLLIIRIRYYWTKKPE